MVRNSFQLSGNGAADHSSFQASAHSNSTIKLWQTAGTSCAKNIPASVVQQTSAHGCLAWGSQRLMRWFTNGGREKGTGVMLHCDQALT